MRGDAGSMTYLRPRDPEEALRLAGECPDALALAGGTDIMVAWNAGRLNGRSILDLSGLDDWRRVSTTRDGIDIGALVTHAQLIRHRELAAGWPLLAAACATVGGPQIQARGTLGGNIANASPAGDTFPALAVYEARVRVRSSRGGRELPFAEVFAGVKRTHLAPGELIVSVHLPRPPEPDRQLFRKVGTRAAQAISKAVAAGLLWTDSGGSVRELRFALGSMAPTVRRLRRAEEFLRGRRLDKGVVSEAARLLEEDVSPISDVRSTAAYRLRASQNILRGFLEGRLETP
ncbi:MAG: xanthine dehydrogenase family protein subunit M [Elusimicrobia bacterium]|nr:xanthine dehydrogenase family protein subunit M [Elusimicrobiota bacterium]